MRVIVPVLTRIFSALLALALIVVGVVVVVEVVAAWVGEGWTILPEDTVVRLRRLHWDDRSVVTTIVIIALVGLVALLVGLWRRAPLTVGLEGRSDVVIERHGLEQSARRRLEALDGVTAAKVRAVGSRLRVRVDSSRRQQPDDVKAAVEDELARLVSEQHVGLSPQVRLRYQGGEL